ncbi:MAG: aminodeoxychorismate synthase component I, partial [Epsilonproteobacteria bacterium]|nr:aminodeoxychorismate synthase component I [Campylobacterota bacterium]
MKFLPPKEGFNKISALASKNIPFLFIISYDKSKIFVEPLLSLPKEIEFSFNSSFNNIGKKGYLAKYPINFNEYLSAFNRVIENIKAGNSYLFNLTFKTSISTNLELKEIFKYAKAPFKLY